MKLTKSKKKRIVKALQAARPHMTEGRALAVWLAIERAFFREHINAEDYLLVIEYAKHLIKPHSTVFDWFLKTHPLIPPPPSWRDYHLAWIDHMIEELSK